MSAGAYRYIAHLERPVKEIPDEFGKKSDRWQVTDAPIRWASLEIVDAGGYSQTDGTHSEATVKIGLRDLAGMDTTWRIKIDGTYYHPIAILGDKLTDYVVVCKRLGSV
jgi:head-tail adaptor